MLDKPMRAPLLLPTTLLLAAALPAQVPDGHFVISSFRYAATNQDGGLAIVHPTTAGPATIVTGLPSALTGSGSNFSGANCVSYSPIDGFVLVGEIAPSGAQIDLHELFVVGGVMVLDLETSVGVSSGSTSGINQIAMLPNGDAVFAVTGLLNAPPMMGESLGYWDRQAGTVAPIPLMGSFFVNGLAVDAGATTIYFYDFGSSQLYSVPITGGSPVPLASLTGVASLAVDANGDLIATSLTDVVRIDVQTGAVTTVALVGANLNGLYIERATGAPVGVLNGISANPGVYRVDGTTAQLLATNISGVGSGVAVCDSMRSYGVSTPGTFDYAFELFPTGGGLPVAGNAGFTIEVEAIGGGGNIGVLAASAASAALPALGVLVLISPVGAITVGPFQPGSSIPLPIPPGLPPTTLFLQSFHLDAGNPGGFAATAGLLLGTIQ